MPDASVSIVMPFRDAETTLGECLASIESQTLEDWELIAIDDGSSDHSIEILENRARSDPRIKVLSPGRIGLVAALNTGIAEARSDFVARMDADDVMAAERLTLQRAHLTANPHLALVSCQVRLFPDDEIQAGYREYIRWQNDCLTSDDVSCEIYVESPFAHPSVMFRREVVMAAGAYRDGDFPEDYELWLRLHHSGQPMEKLPRILLEWRESPGRLSRTDPRYGRDAFDRLRADYLRRDPRLDTDRPIVFWGAGRRTRQRARHLVSHGVTPVAWIDIDPRKIGRRIQNLEVHPPKWLSHDLRPYVLVWVTNHGARDLIARRLAELGYERGCDWLAVG